MRKPRTKLSWKPIRRGAIYCAPACGGGCTKAAHDQAKQTGRIIAMMLGVGWKVSMNENLGWHWTVVSPCGRIRVSGGYKENFPKRFHAMLCQPGDCFCLAVPWKEISILQHGRGQIGISRKPSLDRADHEVPLG